MDIVVLVQRFDDLDASADGSKGTKGHARTPSKLGKQVQQMQRSSEDTLSGR